MTENIKLEKIDFTSKALDNEYYNCTFLACNFSNQNIDNTIFDLCEFKDCDFSLCHFEKTMTTVKFTSCKMIGTDYSKLNRFSSDIIFYKSHLNYANFTNLKTTNIHFKECNILEATFENANITKTIFERCDLQRTSFVGSNLEKVDFSTSYNFSINPTTCKIKKTIFSEEGLKGLVDHLDIVIK